FSYRVADIGRYGVPQPGLSDRRIIERITGFLNAPTLRFVYFGSDILVYNATLGPCGVPPVGYPVLNAASCNLVYSPDDDFDRYGAAPTCAHVPRPWFAE